MKISNRQPKISDSLKISNFSNTLGGAAAPPSTPVIRLWSQPMQQERQGRDTVRCNF